jgi:uncharacterized Zn finger protein
MPWYSYDNGREERARVLRDLERRKKSGENFTPLMLSSRGNKLAHTFWGHAWCRHLETHSDYSNRLPRGRSYLRQGNVYNVQITPGLVTATVAGKSLYEVHIRIEPLRKPAWEEFKQECAGQVGSLLDLLGGKLGDGVLRAITDPQRGLFPKSNEFRFSCSCPDWADMCKHVAAVLYGVGAKLDTSPDLFFVLRSVDPSELLTSTAHETLSQAHGVDEALAGEDLSALFGIDLGTNESANPDVTTVSNPKVQMTEGSKRPTKRKTPPKKTAKRKDPTE